VLAGARQVCVADGEQLRQILGDFVRLLQLERQIHRGDRRHCGSRDRCRHRGDGGRSRRRCRPGNNRRRHAEVRRRLQPGGATGAPKDEQAAGVAASGVQCEAETVQVRPARISWARLLKRVFDIDMQRCPNCGAGDLKIIAAIQERPVIEKILSHLGLDPQPPPKGRVREAGLHFAA
jgi:hypothetical protein